MLLAVHVGLAATTVVSVWLTLSGSLPIQTASGATLASLACRWTGWIAGRVDHQRRYRIEQGRPTSSTCTDTSATDGTADGRGFQSRWKTGYEWATPDYAMEMTKPGTAISSANGHARIIDIHCHLGVAAADALVQAHYPGPPPGINDFTSPQTARVNRDQFAAIGCRLYGVEERLADMDRLGIDIQALSPSPGQYFYFTDIDVGRSAATLVNDGIAEAVASHPDRFVGMGTVPLQDVGAAIVEMRRCVRHLGLRGIEISSNVGGRDLHLPEFRPFFAAAEELGVLLFLHPLGFTHAQRMSEYYFNNLIGNPLESTLAVGHLIFGGVLDRYPGLRICVAHGGGYMPGYWGRMDHGWRARADCREDCAHLPSSYLKKLWFDTLVFDRDELDALVRTYGADRLCMGSDYPFDMSEPDPVGFHERLSAADRARILGGNAAALLGIAADVPSDGATIDQNI